VRRAQKEEIPVILCKIIDDTNIDQRRGKQLVNKVLGKNNPFTEACPATTRKMTYTPVKGCEVSGEETTIIEKRSLTRTELQQYRTEFAQRGEKNVTYLERIWSNGADPVELLATEMRQLAGMTGKPPHTRGTTDGSGSMPRGHQDLVCLDNRGVEEYSTRHGYVLGRGSLVEEFKSGHKTGKEGRNFI
jgi:hypothetical protein